MAMPDTNDILNRLSVIHNRSLAMYLRYAVPWVKNADNEAAATVVSIAEDQQEYVDRIGALILENSGRVVMGEFPMIYTGYHDLSIDFLLNLLIREQQDAIPQIEECVDGLRMHPIARGLAEEALGAAKGHLAALQELSPAPAS